MKRRCSHCYYKWKVKELLSLGFSKKGKNCPNCGVKQYISASTQNWFTLGYLSLIFIPVILFFIKLTDKQETSF